MTDWQVHTMSSGSRIIFIAYEYDDAGFTGRYGYVNGYGQVPSTIHGTSRRK